MRKDVWFTQSKFEEQALKWNSPWGVGYPGWHIECSGISLKYLGEYLPSLFKFLILFFSFKYALVALSRAS